MTKHWNRLTTSKKIAITIGSLAALLALLVGAAWSVLNAQTIAGALGAAPAPSPTATALPTPDPEPDPTDPETVTPDPVKTDAPPPITDAEAAQAEDTAIAALWEVVAQPAGESATARTDRLASYFRPGSPTPTAGPVIPDVAGVADLAIQPIAVQWTEPYDPGDGRIGFMVSIPARATGLVDDRATSWQDTSTQLWRITLARDTTGVWTPDAAYPADQPDPTH